MGEANITNVACPAGTGGCPVDAMLDGDGTHWCKLDRSKLKAPLQDDVTVNVTIANLQQAKAEGRPFFIAAGFHKPHLPFQFPADLRQVLRKHFANDYLPETWVV